MVDKGPAISIIQQQDVDQQDHSVFFICKLLMARMTGNQWVWIRIRICFSLIILKFMFDVPGPGERAFG